MSSGIAPEQSALLLPLLIASWPVRLPGPPASANVQSSKVWGELGLGAAHLLRAGELAVELLTTGDAARLALCGPSRASGDDHGSDDALLQVEEAEDRIGGDTRRGRQVCFVHRGRHRRVGRRQRCGRGRRARRRGRPATPLQRVAYRSEQLVDGHDAVAIVIHRHAIGGRGIPECDADPEDNLFHPNRTVAVAVAVAGLRQHRRGADRRDRGGQCRQEQLDGGHALLPGDGAADAACNGRSLTLGAPTIMHRTLRTVPVTRHHSVG